MESSFRSGCIKIRSCIIFGFASLLIFFSYATSNVNAVEFFSKDDVPFGTSYDNWISKWWNWWVDVNITQIENTQSQEGGCLMNASGEMVMLMETADFINPVPKQRCNISHTQGIMMPLWAAWCSTPTDDRYIDKSKGNLSEQLTQCAKWAYNLGNIISEVKVDGNLVAKLHVKNAAPKESTIFALSNVTEIYTKGFNITIPAYSHKPDYPNNPGTHAAGSQGYWVFLKPLKPGEHTVEYKTGVNPTGAISTSCNNCLNADISYIFNVK